MKKKALATLLVLTLSASMLTACSSKSNESSTTTEATDEATPEVTLEATPIEKEEATSNSELASMTGQPLVSTIDKIQELGYTAKYYADGVDFTDFIDSVKEDYTTGEMTVDDAAKTVDVTLVLTSNIDDSATQDALASKLDVGSAWTAANHYGKEQYGDSFDLNYLIGKIDEYASDENTWFLKAECDVNGEKKTCEVYVTGTTDSPQVVDFTVY